MPSADATATAPRQLLALNRPRSELRTVDAVDGEADPVVANLDRAGADVRRRRPGRRS